MNGKNLIVVFGLVAALLFSGFAPGNMELKTGEPSALGQGTDVENSDDGNSSENPESSGKRGDNEEETPGEDKPEEGKPEEGKPEEGKPEEGKPEEGKPEEGKPEEGKPEEGKPEEGDPIEIHPTPEVLENDDNLWESVNDTNPFSLSPVVIACICLGAAVLVLIAILIFVKSKKKDKGGQAKPFRTETPMDYLEQVSYAGAPIPMVLDVFSGNKRSAADSFSFTGELRIGSGKDCALVWEDAEVLPLHARIVYRNDSFYIEELGPDAAVYLNGMRIQKANRLRNDDIISVGSAEFRLRF